MGVPSLRSTFALSVVLHLVLVAVLGYWDVVQRAQSPAKPNLVIVELDPLKTPTAKKDESLRRTVQTDAGKKVDQAPDQAFLGEKNQIVDRQTVSKNAQTRVGGGRPASPPPQTAVTKSPGRPLATLGMPIIPTQLNRDEMANKDLKTDAAESRPLDARWAPGDELNQDYVKGFEKSERTLLNTKEYVFFGYFQRIRKQLDLAWTATLKDHLVRYYRRGRRLAADMDYLTQTLVTLNKGGEVVRVQVVAESGTRDLDDAAVKAFNKAGPFPNPPNGIVDPQGMIQIRWDFVLKN